MRSTSRAGSARDDPGGHAPPRQESRRGAALLRHRLRAAGVLTMSMLPIRTRRWTRKEDDRLVELGVLHEDEPIELVDGQMVVREPKHTPHVTATAFVVEALRGAFGAGWWVRALEPVALDDDSEPEPNVTVVRGAPRDYLAEHPSRPALVVEVAQSSLAFDRRRKGGLYARAGIEDYWIVDLVGRALEFDRLRARLRRHGVQDRELGHNLLRRDWNVLDDGAVVPRTNVGVEEGPRHRRVGSGETAEI